MLDDTDKKKCIAWMHCKSLWIKASAKCINVNVNVDDFDNTLTYGQFMNHHGFSVPPKDCNILLKAIPAGLIQVVISHLMFSKSNVIYPAFLLGGINILDRKCNNRHIHKPFQIKRKITPRGKFYWNLFITDIVWKKPGFYQVRFVYLSPLQNPS